ncbi:hypothetical protein KUTeg_007985 [Tegillarca granosa]|uniref:Uncharacterized protein n=1 Tax=Tegillarca granosa TaxID=220873 RepID=A0ABQ9FHS3_TEGGR|nr:hypothetical protein KUTeg_007985 [Tegillarca granosa]
MMDTNPGRKNKTDNTPFYEKPENVTTSADIIKEARQSITGLRPVSTKRPFTPRDDRRLFGTASSRNPETRPPSAFSKLKQQDSFMDKTPVHSKVNL